jgi:hypothetical protein
MGRHPPLLAVWLLERLGYMRLNPALVGDLQEEFLGGRSAGWYWRQAFMVVANGVVRNAAVLQDYLKAHLVGFALQIPVAFALCSMGVPGKIHGLGSGVLAVVALLATFIVLAGVKSRVTGDARADLRLLLIVGSETQRSRTAIARFVTADAFATYFLAYVLYSLFVARFSALELAGVELFWLIPLELAPTLLRVPESRRREAAPASVAPPRVWPSQDLVLTVVLADGRTVDLRPESAVEMALAVADDRLIGALFRNSASLELIRSAISLGSVRRYCALLEKPEANVAITVQELESLIDEAARKWRSARPFSGGWPR